MMIFHMFSVLACVRTRTGNTGGKSSSRCTALAVVWVAGVWDVRCKEVERKGGGDFTACQSSAEHSISITQDLWQWLGHEM